MSKLRSFQRHLNPSKVWLANQVAEEKIKIARQVVLDRAKKEAAFAADVLKAVGDALPKEIKEACEASVAKEETSIRAADAAQAEEAKKVVDGESQDEHIARVLSAGVAAKIDSEILQDMITHSGDLTHTMVPVQTDGGGEILVHETELPDYPRDGEKLVMMEGPKAEKA